MTIRRKDNHFKTMPLPTNVVSTEQGWHVPIFSEMPDDLFITYSIHEWELVGQKKAIPEKRPTHEVASLLLSEC